MKHLAEQILRFLFHTVTSAWFSFARWVYVVTARNQTQLSNAMDGMFFREGVPAGHA